MFKGLNLSPPFFELGPKAYLYGSQVLQLAKFADEISFKYNVQIIFTPQYVDIPLLSKETKHLLIFAQHMDALRMGRGVGSVLPEAVKEAGACGVLLNHAEKPLSQEAIRLTIQRADEVGLASMVCAGSMREVEAVALMCPNIVLAEPPELIGTGKRGAKDQAAIRKINSIVWNINPDILVLHGAGISSGQDVYDIIALGAQATGSSSGVLLANNPFDMLEEMVSNVRQAWDDTH